MTQFLATCRPDKSFKLFFHYHYVNISKAVIDTWEPSEYNSILQDYALHIAPQVLKSVGVSDKEVLESIIEDKTYIQMTHPTQPSGCWFRALLPISLIGDFKKLFISTIVYHNNKESLAVPESVTFLFDTEKKTVTITELVLYRPANNPFFEYAQKAAILMSAEAIGLDNYQNEEDGIRDLYDSTKMIPWRERSKLDSEDRMSERPGIYMLFDKNSNSLYIGKGIRVIDRIIQHTKNTNDPISSFTHYRYSSISEEYIEFLYLIENAAIHDAAWLIKMPAAKKYKHSLSEKIDSLGLSIQNCNLINTVEHQTRKQ